MTERRRDAERAPLDDAAVLTLRGVRKAYRKPAGDDYISILESADLVGPLAGQDLSVLIQTIRTGGAYVNVHTNDGIGPTNEGPGDFPAGEIRGQIRSAGPQ